MRTTFCGTQPVRNSARPAVTATSAQPQEVRQHDADVDLPRRKSRRAVYPRTPIAPAMSVYSLVLEVDIYDGRPPAYTAGAAQAVGFS